MVQPGSLYRNIPEAEEVAAEEAQALLQLLALQVMPEYTVEDEVFTLVRYVRHHAATSGAPPVEAHFASSGPVALGLFRQLERQTNKG